MRRIPLARLVTRTTGALLSGVVAFGLSLNPAAADFGDVFFGTLKKWAADTPFEDPVEMARYSAYNPDNAKIVYQRAVAGGYYTYVFLGLIAGVKSIRGKHFPDLGTFSYESCMAPRTFVDLVFSKVNGYMDAAAAEVDLGGFGNELKAYAVDYGKAQSEEAKDELNAEIAAKIPFWDDIPVICHFSFFTDFEHDKSLQATVWSTVEGIGSAYQDLAAAKVGDAIGKLLALGVNETTVCQLADDAIAGGWMNKIPAVSEVGNTLCAGFTGFFINATAWAGSVLEDIGAVTGISNFGDWLAGQTQHVPPEQYYANVWQTQVWAALNNRLKNPAFDFGAFATSIRNECIAYFDAHTMSESTATKVCEQHKAQFTAYYNDLALAMLSQKALGAAVVAAKNASAKYRTSNLWGAVNPDPTNSFRVVATPGTVAALALTNLVPPSYDVGTAVDQAVATMQPAFELAAARAAQRAEEQKAAAAAIQKAVKDQADDAEKANIDPWLKKCGDDICRAEVLTKREACRQQILKAIADNPVDPDMPASLAKRKKAVDAINKACETVFAKSIEASAKRLLADPSAGPSVLAKLGCTNFLGRAKEQLCFGKVAFDACKPFVDRNLLRSCTLPGKPPTTYANTLMNDPKADPRIRAALWECTNFLGRASQMLCPGEKGFAICKLGVDQGLLQECTNTATKQKYAAKAKPPPPPPPPPTADAALRAAGCKFFLGRRGDWLCQTAAAYTMCLGYLTKNEVSACNAAGQARRISIALLEQQLGRTECKRGQPGGPPRPGQYYYFCPNRTAVTTCDTAKRDFVRAAAVHCQLAVAAVAPVDTAGPTTGGLQPTGPTGGTLGRPPGGTGTVALAAAPLPKVVSYRTTLGRNTIVGRFSKGTGNAWIESNQQTSPPQTLRFRFEQREATPTRIDLLDASRNMWVRLDLAAKRVLLSTDARRTWQAAYPITAIE